MTSASTASWWTWLRRISLRGRLLWMLFVIIALLLVGQTLVSLSGELSAIDRQVEMEGTIVAQGIATASAPLMDGTDPRRFDDLIERVRKKLRLVTLAILRGDGRVLAHTDPTRVGTLGRRIGGLTLVRPGRGLAAMGGPLEYRVSAPIARSTFVLGFVELTFLSEEVPQRAVAVIYRAAAFGLFWFAVAALGGVLYLRRITRPLGALTRAVRSLHEGQSQTLALPPPEADDELGLLQTAFSELTVALDAERARNATLVGEQQQMNLLLQERVAQTTADLRQAGAYLQSVIRCIGEGLLTCNEQGEVVQANQAALRLLAEVGPLTQGRSIGELFAGQSLLEAVRRAIDTRSAQQLEVHHEPKGRSSQACDVAARTFLFHVYPLDTETAGRGAVLLVSDITEQQDREKRLRTQDRLASLGTLAAGLAHEFGNYMHAIHGFGGLLLRSVPKDDPRHNDVAAIHHESSRAIALLDRFLQFARPGQGAVQVLALDDLVREAVELCSYQLRQANISVLDQLGGLEAELKADGALVSGDPRLLRQVFMNLVLNAVEAMRGREQRRLLVSSLRQMDRVEVAVTDTGGGIAAQHREHIFDPFFTTKESGTGLGLSICHQIVERHGGSLVVDSELGVGSTFRVLLPLTEPQGGKS